jgi:uncharacterized protein YggU (UPF0235/DUF167 family)
MYIKVIAHPQSKKEVIKTKNKEVFEIWLKEKAERNMANKRILEILALYLGINKNKIRIINGHNHPHKLLFFEDKL